MANFQIGVVHFKEHLELGPGETRDMAFRLLREADVILAGRDKHNQALIHGTECLEDVAYGRIDESVQKKMVIVYFEDGDFDQQADELRKLLVELKGTFCNEADDVNRVAEVDAAKELPPGNAGIVGL